MKDRDWHLNIDEEVGMTTSVKKIYSYLYFCLDLQENSEKFLSQQNRE